MYCDKCGNHVDDNALTCSNCGNIFESKRVETLESVQASNQRSGPSVKSIVTLILIIITVISIIISRIDSKENSDAINEVQNGYLTYYSQDITIKQAFENFFGNPNWDAGKVDDENYPELKGEQLVNFTGKFYYEQKEANILIQFIVEKDGSNFYLFTIEKDGEPLNEWQIDSVLSVVYSN